MPAESYTPDPALVDLVARAAYEADSKQILGDEQLTWDEQPEQCHDWFRVIARAVLAALATEGRLRDQPQWAVDLIGVRTRDGRIYAPQDVELIYPTTEES